MSTEAVAAGEIEGRSARVVSWPGGLLTVLSVGLGYGLVHAGLRLALSANLAQDDAAANVLAQTLEPGYVPRQPPLYEWLLWSVQRLIGPTLPSFLILKYGLLTATLCFLYLVAKRIFADRRWAVIAALSPLLLYQIGWNLHEGVTHTMVLVCAVAASFWAFIRVVERGAVQDYLLFGMFVGLGLISKWSFAAYCIALAGAALLQAETRARLLDWRMLLSVGTAAIIVAPAIYWLVTGGHDLLAVYDQAVAPAASNRWAATLTGLGLAVFAPLAFLFPLDLLLPILFPRMVREALVSVRGAFDWNSREDRPVAWDVLILHMTFASFLILVCGALLTGATHYLERYMHPMFLLTPLWLLAMVARTGNAPQKLKVLTAVFAASILVVLPIRLNDLLHALGPTCHKCRVAIPYQGLATALEERGFRSGTIIAQSRHAGGNLRRLFPDARIVCLESPSYAPPLSSVAKTEQVAVVLNAVPAKRYVRRARSQAEALGARIDGTPGDRRDPLGAAATRECAPPLAMVRDRGQGG